MRIGSVQIENGNMHEMPDFTSKEKDLTEIEEAKSAYKILGAVQKEIYTLSEEKGYKKTLTYKVFCLCFNKK